MVEVIATVIGSASIRLTAEDAGLKEQINRDLNDAIKSSKITSDPLVAVQQQLRASELDLVKAQQASATAEGELAKAEAVLTTLRQAREPDTKAITAAELAFYRAQLEVAAATDKVSQAQRTNSAIESVLAKAVKDVAAANSDSATKTSLFGKVMGVFRGTLNAVTHPLTSTRSGVINLGSGIRDLSTRLVQAPIKAVGRLFDDFGTKAKNASRTLAGGAWTGFKKLVTEAVASPLTFATAGFAGLQKLGSGALSVLGSKLSLFASGGAAALGPLTGALLALPGIAIAGAGAIAVLKLGADGLKAATQQLTPAVDGLKKSISGVFQRQLTPVFATLRPVITGLTGDLDGMARSVSGVIKQLVGVVTSKAGLDQIKTSLAGASQFVTAMGPGLANLLQLFLTLASTVAPQMKALGASIGGIFTAIGQAVSQLQSSAALFNIFQQLPSLFTALGSVIRPLLVILGNLAASLTGPLAAALSGVGAALTAAEPGLQAFGAAIGSALGALAPLLAAIGPLLGQVASLLGSVLASAVRALAPPLTTLINGLSRILAPVLPILSEAFNQLAQALAPIANVLVKALLLVFQALAPMLPTIVSFIAQLAGILGQLLAAVLPILPPVLQLASALFPLLIQILQAAIPVLLAVVAGVNAVVPPLAALVQFITSLVIPIIKSLLPVVTVVFTAVAKIVTDAMNIVKGIVQLVLGLLTGNWRQAMDGIRSIVSGAWNLIKDTFTGALNAIKGAVPAALNAVISIFRNLPGSILHVLGNLGSLLLGAGKAIVSGLIRGIKATIGLVASTLTGSLSGAVSSVTHLLGIGSPSRLFHGFGVFIMQGLANGVAAGTRTAVAAMSRAAAAIAGAGSFDTSTNAAANAAAANAISNAVAPPSATPADTGTSSDGDLYLTLDLGEGITQRIRIANKELVRAVKTGATSR